MLWPAHLLGNIVHRPGSPDEQPVLCLLNAVPASVQKSGEPWVLRHTQRPSCDERS